MKTTIKLFIMVMTLSMATVSYAQTYGVKGGLNLTTFLSDGDTYSDQNMRMGFHAGAFAEFEVSRSIGFRPELLYSQKGSTVTSSILVSELETTQKVDYLELPLLANIHLLDPLSFQVGPYLSYLMNYSYTVKSGSSSSSDDLDKEDLNSFDYGLAVGVTYRLNSLEIGARYGLGLSTIGKDQDLILLTYNPIDAKNSTLTFSVGYVIGGK